MTELSRNKQAIINILSKKALEERPPVLPAPTSLLDNKGV